MANPHKGEVEFESRGAKYVLVFDVNALVEIEEDLGADFIEKSLPDGNVSRAQWRRMFWIVLRQRHPEIDDERKAGALTTFGHMTQLMGEAMRLSQPEQAGLAEANPPKPGEPEKVTGPAPSSDGAATG